MGDKAAARKAMQAVGVPIIPGTPGGIDDPEAALEFARGIGFPVIIKAAAGGGGKGMRVATEPDDFVRSFQLARSEALSAFGNGEVYVEKYLARPRAAVAARMRSRAVTVCERSRSNHALPS